MVRRSATHQRYRLGFRYLEVVRGAWLEPDLIAAARFELRSLRDLTGETAVMRCYRWNAATVRTAIAQLVMGIVGKDQ